MGKKDTVMHVILNKLLQDLKRKKRENRNDLLVPGSLFH